MLSLSGKRILVTGASSGIGRQIAITAASLDAAVVLLGRNEQRLQETLDLLKEGPHEKAVVDLTNAEQLNELLKGAGVPFDGVVFNAGIVEYSPIKFINPEKIKHILDTNFNSTVLLCQGLLKNKLIRKKGSLVFISSISSKIGVPGTALYAASKAAVGAFSRVVAAEVAGLMARANSISPGIVITPMTEQAKDVASDSAMDEGAKAYPLGYGSPEDVANLTAYLLSDLSKWMTGNDLLLDGGFMLS